MNYHKSFRYLMFFLGTLIFATSTVYAQAGTTQAPRNVQGPDFIVFPEPPNVQGSIDLALSCRNGVLFEFHVADLQADLEGVPLDWDISFANENGLLINSFPLWPAESAVVLVQDEYEFPYSVQQMLLWRERVPAGPLAMCISGPGTGFCETTITIDNCYITPSLVTDISQVAERSTEPIVNDHLVFETRAYDPRIGTLNGEGIESVVMSIIDRATGEDVYWGPPIGSSEVITETRFCLFDEGCSPYGFADNDYLWPNGEPIVNGNYFLRSTVSTAKDERMVVQRAIEITDAPAVEGAWINPVDGATYLPVPAGDFLMGSDEDYSDEAPQHLVTLDEYRIMETEVTNAQYAACVEAGACVEPTGSDRWSDSEYADHPVTNVDWNQAVAYATWVGGRLPSEAEWEKAARGTEALVYPWGADQPTDLLANVDAPTGDTMPVGSYPDGASPYGVLDMSGNVEEWVADWYGPTYYAESPQLNPQGTESPRPPLKVLRGGSFQQSRYDVRTSVRGRANPETKYGNVGFRVVVSQ